MAPLKSGVTIRSVQLRSRHAARTRRARHRPAGGAPGLPAGAGRLISVVRRLLVAGILVTVPFGVSSLAQASDLIGERFRTKSSDGVILRSEAKEIVAGFPELTVKKEDVEAFERALPEVLRRELGASSRIVAQLGAYKRVYEPIQQGGFLMRVNFFHSRTEIVRKGKWLSARHTVMGGGSDYFAVEWDLKRARLWGHVWVNDEM